MTEEQGVHGNVEDIVERRMFLKTPTAASPGVLAEGASPNLRDHTAISESAHPLLRDRLRPTLLK
jgi:hypothetical protein